MTKTLTKESLAHFTGTSHWYRHPLNRRVTYTDGAQHVAETGEAYWLLDEIAIPQIEQRYQNEEFQVWKLTVDLEKTSGVLTCDDGNGREISRKVIEYTDFPLDEITFYFENDVICLPSER
jgi:hypothetical protein